MMRGKPDYPKTRRDAEVNENLGKLVGEVSKEIGSISDFLDDPITRESSCGYELLPSFSQKVMARVQRLIQDAGYEYFKEFLDEVEARTSPKWAYFYSGIEHLEDINGDRFWVGGRGL
jgi:hypothetical protein